MRIIWDDDYVEEFFSLNATKGWENSHDYKKDIPDVYSVSMDTAAPNGFNFDYIGSYNLDGTKETYEAAVKNFKAIVHDAATNGYIYASQFENFEFY